MEQSRKTARIVWTTIHNGDAAGVLRVFFGGPVLDQVSQHDPCYPGKNVSLSILSRPR